LKTIEQKYSFAQAWSARLSSKFDIELNCSPVGLTQRELTDAIHSPYQQVHELVMRSEMLVLSWSVIASDVNRYTMRHL